MRLKPLALALCIALAGCATAPASPPAPSPAEAAASEAASAAAKASRLDQLYAASWSVRLDLTILFWTCAAVLMRRQVAVHRGSGRMNLRRR